MRIACLVVAYNAASVLRSALAIYAKLGWDVFVHLDRKADIGVYREALGERGNFCRFVEGPLAVFWGGFSMMRAEFRLIERALSSGSYDRFVLLSDDSFPVRSLVDLQKLLAEDVDRITAVRQPEGSDFYKRYHGYFYFDHGATNPRGGLHGREIDEALVGKIAEARDLMLRGKKLIDIYFGSQFWILQQSTIEDIVELCHSDAHLQKSFEFSALPDELMFQSVFGSYLRNRFYTHGPVFSDFSRGHGPLTYSSFNQLPPEFPEHIAFIRKVDAKATLFLRELEDRMIAGGWFGLPPTSLTSSVASIKTRCASQRGADVALGKPATQSSLSQWSRGKTVEEDANGANSNMDYEDYAFCTANEAKPWWQVDLLESFSIAEVHITNRKTSPERLRRFSLLTSLDGRRWELLYQKADDSVFGQNGDDSLILRFSTRQQVARYVRLRLDTSGFLHIRSLRIFGESVSRG